MTRTTLLWTLAGCAGAILLALIFSLYHSPAMALALADLGLC